MNIRDRSNLSLLQSIMNTGIEKFKNIEQQACYLILSNAGLRSRGLKNTGMNHLAYLIGEEIYQSKQAGIFPELYKTKENVLLCDCPGFQYYGNKETQFCQAISLELALNMSQKIQGIIVVIDYNDFYVARGAGYRELRQQLMHLFAPDFDILFKSAIFVVINKSKTDSIEEIKEGILIDKKQEIADREEELATIDIDEQDSFYYQQAKMELSFTQLFIFHEKQIFILDPSDKGESRLAILLALANINPIDFNQFKFARFYDEVLKGVEFNLRKFIDELVDKMSTHTLSLSASTLY